MYGPTYVNRPYDPGPPPAPPLSNESLTQQLHEKITIVDGMIDDLTEILAALATLVASLRNMQK